MSRVPIRARLTAAFALAMAVVLAGAGLFVYLRLAADLDEAVDESLRTRADAVAALARESDSGSADAGALEDAEEGFAQVLSVDGQVLDASGGADGPALSAEDLERAAGEPLLFEREVAGVEGTARVLALPVSRGTGAPAVVAVGQTLSDRDETLGGLVASFAIGGPLAVLLASMLGYALAAAGLRPVEAMRRRAEQVSLRDHEQRLPLPDARDEVRRLGETLNEMLDRLRRSFERERRFVADASHELRTPVAVVKTELEGALRTGDYGPQVREALVAAVEECDRLAQLAEDLLVIARAADGKLPVRLERLDAREALDRIRERFVDRAAEHGRRLDVEAPDGLLLSADPLRLRQAIGNLLDNALRHGEGDVAIVARRSGSGVEIDVSDGGAGFGAAMDERAFERFTRGDEARVRGGAGLGLAIVRAIADAHGGSAAIVPGAGATVRVWLPDAVSSAARAADGQTAGYTNR